VVSAVARAGILCSERGPCTQRPLSVHGATECAWRDRVTARVGALKRQQCLCSVNASSC
jgi:hypothetical protein